MERLRALPARLPRPLHHRTLQSTRGRGSRLPQYLRHRPVDDPASQLPLDQHRWRRHLVRAKLDTRRRAGCLAKQRHRSFQGPLDHPGLMGRAHRRGVGRAFGWPRSHGDDGWHTRAASNRTSALRRTHGEIPRRRRMGRQEPPLRHRGHHFRRPWKNIPPARLPHRWKARPALGTPRGRTRQRRCRHAHPLTARRLALGKPLHGWRRNMVQGRSIKHPQPCRQDSPAAWRRWPHLSRPQSDRAQWCHDGRPQPALALDQRRRHEDLEREGGPCPR